MCGLFSVFMPLPQGWRPTVRPPRLGGNARLGVFATRSTFSPQSAGVVGGQAAGHRYPAPGATATGRGDLLNGTPSTTSNRICHTPMHYPRQSVVLRQDGPARPLPVRFSAEAELCSCGNGSPMTAPAWWN